MPRGRDNGGVAFALVPISGQVRGVVAQPWRGSKIGLGLVGERRKDNVRLLGK